LPTFASRCLLACEALQSATEAHAFTVFENVFKEFGLRPPGQQASMGVDLNPDSIG
jgi:hypothetical protein